MSFPKGICFSPRARATLLTLLLASLLSANAQTAHKPTPKKHAASHSTPAKPGTTGKRAPAAKAPTTRKSHPTTRGKSSPHTKVSTRSPAAMSRTATSRTALPRAVPVSRPAVIQRIMQSLSSPRLGMEGAAYLRPFFDQLHQLELAPKDHVVRILQYGDSHTAADLFTGALRTLFQTRFGDAGAGFQYPGYPFAGYRIHGTRRAQSVGWTVEGTHFRDLGDDALVGMGGVSLSTTQAGDWVSLDADAASVEVQYMTQPGGGTIEIYDGTTLLSTVSTDGPVAAAQYDSPLDPLVVPHHIEVRTTQHAPVRLLGMVTENRAGVTYEAIGLNGAEAGLILRWNEGLQQPLLASRDPTLIVLAYGTNEAGDHTWTEEGYAAMFRSLIARFRRIAPNASILVVGPPDRDLKAGRAGWAPFTGVDRIVQAQRSVCRQMHCAFWDQRARMGGFGTMHDWVSIQWAQGDHTHFTGEGYTELASALFSDIVQQYEQTPAAPRAADTGSPGSTP